MLKGSEKLLSNSSTVPEGISVEVFRESTVHDMISKGQFADCHACRLP